VLVGVLVIMLVCVLGSVLVGMLVGVLVGVHERKPSCAQMCAIILACVTSLKIKDGR
jgi:hypothetical protein